MYYIELQNFKLTSDLLQELLSLKFNIKDNNLNDLGKYDVTPALVRGYIFTHESKAPFKQQYLKFYGGEALNRVGKMRAFEIPTHLADEVLFQFKELTDLTNERPEIRMQYSFDGECIPIHYDVDKRISIIYPLENHSGTFTNFFEHVDDIDAIKAQYNKYYKPGWPALTQIKDIQLFPDNLQRYFYQNPGYISSTLYGELNRKRNNSIPNPFDVQLVDSIEIKDHPVLLNVDKLHDVVWPKNSLTSDNPRVSLYIKYKTLKFREIVNSRNK